MKIKDCKYRTIGKDPLINSKHFHINTIELIQPLTNGGNVLINDKLYPMISGAVYCIDSEDLHCTLPQSEQNYCRNKITVPKDSFKRILSDLGDENLLESLISKGIIILDEQKRKKVENLFFIIAEKHLLNDEFSATLSLLEICSILNSKPEQSKTAQNEQIEKILQYINENLQEGIKLKDICQNLFISESYLCHIFKKELGMTVKGYIKEQQIIKAVSLLKNTSLSLESVAFSCGFSSHSQFSKCFRAKFNCSPKSYRTSKKA